ncbi:hypothetical protein E4U41_005134, partial [Claviceps citrina]
MLPTSLPLFRWASLLCIALAVAIAVALSSSSSSSSSSSWSTTHCYRGIRTLDHDNPSARCFTVLNGTFTRVWTPRSLPARRLHDGYALPGLWDSHGHLLAWGEFLHSVDLFNARSLAE